MERSARGALPAGSPHQGRWRTSPARAVWARLPWARRPTTGSGRRRPPTGGVAWIEASREVLAYGSLPCGVQAGFRGGRPFMALTSIEKLSPGVKRRGSAARAEHDDRTASLCQPWALLGAGTGVCSFEGVMVPNSSPESRGFPCAWVQHACQCARLKLAPQERGHDSRRGESEKARPAR